MNLVGLVPYLSDNFLEIFFYENLPDGMTESPIRKSLCDYVGGYAKTAYDPPPYDICNCSRDDIEEGRCNCFDYLYALPYRLKYLERDHSITFSFTYDYGDFSPESITIVQSSLYDPPYGISYNREVSPKPLFESDEEFFCGMIRAAFDVYYAQTHGLTGYPAFIRCYGGQFYEGMRVVYSLVPGFDTPRETITLPAAKGQGTAKKTRKKPGRKPRKGYPITQGEAAKLITEVYQKLGMNKTCSERTLREWEKDDDPKKNPIGYWKEWRKLKTEEAFKRHARECIYGLKEEQEAKKKNYHLRESEASVDPEFPEI